MKQLIIILLLLFVCSVSAQTLEVVDAWISSKQSTLLDTVYATITPFNEAGLLNLLELYEADCYADSVENGYLVGMYWEDGISKSKKHYFNDIPYRHREPTFTGFIEFLKRRKHDTERIKR